MPGVGTPFFTIGTPAAKAAAKAQQSTSTPAAQNPNFTYSVEGFGTAGDGISGFGTVPTGLSAQGAAAANSATQELMQSLGNVDTDTGQELGDQAQAQGYTNEANAYTNAENAYGGVEGAYATAATLANQNATLETAAGNVQQYQEGLQAKQTIGSQRAGIAAAGFGNSGSALNLLAASNRQAALTQALTGINTNIAVTGYKQQAAAATGQENAAVAQAAATGAQAAAASGAANAATVAAQAAGASANFNQVQSQNYAAQLAQLGSYTGTDVAASQAAGVAPLGQNQGGYSPTAAITSPQPPPSVTNADAQASLNEQAAAGSLAANSTAATTSGVNLTQ